MRVSLYHHRKQFLQTVNVSLKHPDTSFQQSFLAGLNLKIHNFKLLMTFYDTTYLVNKEQVFGFQMSPLTLSVVCHVMQTQKESEKSFSLIILKLHMSADYLCSRSTTQTAGKNYSWLSFLPIYPILIVGSNAVCRLIGTETSPPNFCFWLYAT